MPACTSSSGGAESSPEGGTGDGSPTADGATACRREAGANTTGCAKTSASPVAWWPLGDVRDVIGCNDGMMVGTGGGFVPAKVGQGYSTMQSSYIVVPDAPELRPVNYTVMAWVNVTGVSGLNKWIVSKGPSSGLDVDFTYALAVAGSACCVIGPQAFVSGPQVAGHLYLDFGDGKNEQLLFSDNPVPLGSFVHVAATADGSTISLWVNGKLAGSAKQQLSPKGNTDPIMIGGANYLPGVVDEVMLWNTALTGAEIAAIVAAGSSGVCRQ